MFLALFATILPAAHGQAPNVYVTADGSPSGSCTSNIQTPAFFNNSANWGTGPNQIGPGTTVHLCGTITLAAGGTGLTVQGSGSSSSPITIRFETGAVLQSPQFDGSPGASFGGAILDNGYNYITIDGGTNGIIQNTSNGASTKTCLSGGACTIQQASVGIYLNNTTGVTVQNLTIRGIYFCAANGAQDSGSDTADIYAAGAETNLTITNNTLLDSRTGIGGDLTGGNWSNVNISKNTIQHHDWHIQIGSGATSYTSSNVNVFYNSITNWNDWNGGGSASYHADGMIFWGPSPGPTFSPNIYDNYFYGDLDGGTGAGTAYVYCTYGSGGNTNSAVCNIFNNVFNLSAGNSNSHCAAAVSWNAIGTTFYNNTLVGLSSCNTGNSIGFFINGSGATIENNIVEDFQQAISCPYNPCTTAVGMSNYNDWYNDGGSAEFGGTEGNYTFAQWQALGYDTNSSQGNPNLTAAYVPQSGSPAIGLATNLTSLGIAALDTGAPQTFGLGGSCGTGCTTRSSSGAWDAGPYPGSPGTPPPGAPTRLSVVIK